MSNTGGDVCANQFDLMMPGRWRRAIQRMQPAMGHQRSGRSIWWFFLTECSGSHAQKKESFARSAEDPGGFGARRLHLVRGLVQVADNPKFTSEQTNCPF